MTRSLLGAANIAGKRALEVWWAGFLAIMFWGCLVTFGPAIQAKVFPVITNYRIVEISRPEPGILAFKAAFTKTMDCKYLGLTWFMRDDKGQATRQQITMAKDQPSPTTGPVGDRLGATWEVAVKDEDREMLGLLHHSCGFPWESRSLVGPFVLSRGPGGVKVIDPAR